MIFWDPGQGLGKAFGSPGTARAGPGLAPPLDQQYLKHNPAYRERRIRSKSGDTEVTEEKRPALSAPPNL